jgi:TPR repeat protein
VQQKRARIRAPWARPWVATAVLGAALACQAPSSSSSSPDAGDAAAPSPTASEELPVPPSQPPELRPFPEGIVPAAKALETKAIAGDGAAAVELFDWIRSGNGLPDEAPRAAAIAARACATSVQDACGRLGLLYLRGDGVTRNVAHGTKLLDAACAGGSTWSCARIGAERVYATRLPLDLVRGVPQLEGACSKGSVFACDTLLRSMQRNLVARKDFEALKDRRFAAAAAACKERRHYDCMEWFDVPRGVGVEKALIPREDQQIPSETLCSAGDYASCINVKEDRFFFAWRVACANGDSRGCNAVLVGDLITPMCGKGDCQACEEVVSSLTEKPGQPNLLAIADRACAMGCGRVCDAALPFHPPAPTPKDTVEEQQRKPGDRDKHKWLRLACEGGSGPSCYRFAQELDDVELYEKACPATPRFFSRFDLSAAACLAAADAYRSGRGVRRDLSHASELYDRACRAGGESGYGLAGCRALGELAESRPSPDLSRALAYYAAGCLSGERNGDWESCLRARELTQRGIPADAAARDVLQKRLTNLLFENERGGGSNACGLLPLGSACWVGADRGTCDANPEALRPVRVCRLGVTMALEVDASTGGADGGSGEVARRSGCAMAQRSSCSRGASVALVLVLVGLLLRRRARAVVAPR